MTEKEALEYLKNRYLVAGSPLNPPTEECERHNAVVDMAIKALERRVPVQPNLEGDGYDDYKFCPNCGQAIDWSVEDDD